MTQRPPRTLPGPAQPCRLRDPPRSGLPGPGPQASPAVALGPPASAPSATQPNAPSGPPAWRPTGHRSCPRSRWHSSGPRPATAS
eukprot:9044506-Heterocapsa_arctica.AAC.1